MKITVNCDREIAFDSPDHLYPRGASKDNSRNRRFNVKLTNLFAGKPLKILDLGCAGGGFVRDCIDMGHLAVGLEGSDFSKKFKRAEWACIPEFLFTCDVAGNFDILDESGERIMFDVVTAWELMEHISEKDLPKVMQNIRKHLLPTGLLIVSISSVDDAAEGIHWHQSIKPKQWWIEKFQGMGFSNLYEHLRWFNTQFVRSTKTDGTSFNLVLSYDKLRAPVPPRQHLRAFLFDRWYGSKFQKLLRDLIV